MRLSEEEISKCKGIFGKFDKEQTGRIDRFELRVVLEEMGERPSEEEVFAMINEVDEENSGKVEFYEFLRVYEKHQNAKSNNDEEDMGEI